MMEELIASNDPKKALIAQLLKKFRDVGDLDEAEELGEGNGEDVAALETENPGAEVALDEYTNENRPKPGENVDLREEMKKFFSTKEPEEKKALRVGMGREVLSQDNKPLLKKKTVSIA